jgi:hypothetical protein
MWRNFCFYHFVNLEKTFPGLRGTLLEQWTNLDVKGRVYLCAKVASTTRRGSCGRLKWNTALRNTAQHRTSKRSIPHQHDSEHQPTPHDTHPPQCTASHSSPSPNCRRASMAT